MVTCLSVAFGVCIMQSIDESLLIVILLYHYIPTVLIFKTNPCSFPNPVHTSPLTPCPVHKTDKQNLYAHNINSSPLKDLMTKLLLMSFFLGYASRIQRHVSISTGCSAFRQSPWVDDEDTFDDLTELEVQGKNLRGCTNLHKRW